MGGLLGAAGALNRFKEFMLVLGAALPPIAGIMLVEYFVLRTWRKDLDHSRAVGILPDSRHTLRVEAQSSACDSVACHCWWPSSIIGYVVPWGIKSVNAVGSALLMMAVAGRL